MKSKVSMTWEYKNNFKSFYILLHSNDFLTTFPLNNIFNFRNKLNKQYNLSDNWQVALCDIQLFIGDTVVAENNVHVFCDIITETQIGTTDEQLLRCIPIRENDITRDWLIIDFQTKYYVPLKTTSLSEIGIRIETTAPVRTYSTEYLHRQNKNTTLLLHFKKGAEHDRGQ